jgi:hypothetical protein
VEEGGLTAEQAGTFRIYRVDKGLCAHLALAPDLHVFQVGDLDLYPSPKDFIASLSVPTVEGNTVRARTSGDDISVDISNMSIELNGRPGHDWSDKLYAGPWLFADWDDGRISVRLDSWETVFSDEALRGLFAELPREAEREGKSGDGQKGLQRK